MTWGTFTRYAVEERVWHRINRPGVLGVHRNADGLGVHRRAGVLSVHRRAGVLSVHRRAGGLGVQ